jgi:hypothetical protein
MATKHGAYRPQTLYRDALVPSEKTPHKVCTVWPESVFRPHSAFGLGVTIPGRPGKDDPPQPGALNNRYGFALCPPGIERDDLGSVRTLALLAISAKRIAMDVIGLSDEGRDEIPSSDGTRPVMAAAVGESELSKKGYFVPAGDDPTEEEIAAAELRRDKWLRSQINKADAAWNENRADKIPSDALVAARWLGVKRPWTPDWSADGKVEQACPACRNPVIPGAKKCVHCHEWIGYDENGAAYITENPARAMTAEADRRAKAAAVAAKLDQEA